MRLPVISLHQPWGSLLVSGSKANETRSWACPLPPSSVIAIHAARRWDRKLEGLCAQEPFRSAVDSILSASPDVTRLPLGCLVGLVRLRECLVTSEAVARGMIGPDERAFGDYSPGRYAWIFDRRLVFHEPIPLVGRQGIFYWDVPACHEAMVADWPQPPATE